MNYADLIFETLSRRGVSYCCAVPGGGIMYLVDAVGRNNCFRTRFFHHEQAAGFAAECYGRVESKLAVCLITIGPGVANAVAAAFSCFINSVPCLFISGAKRSTFDTNYVQQRFNFPQDCDTENIVAPVVKHYHLLNYGEDVALVISKMLALAREGRPGPVWLDVPLDVQGMQAAHNSHELLQPQVGTAVNTSLLWNFLNLTKRPVFLLGRGCESIFRTADYQLFLSQSKIPFITTIGSNHLLKHAGDMNLGFFGPTGRRAANRVLTEADSIIAIGSGLDIDNTGFDRTLFFRNKRILTINSDPWLDISEAEHWEKITARVQDINLSELTAFLVGQRARLASWAEFCQAVNRLLSVGREIDQNLSEDGVDPYLFCLRLSQVAPDNTGFVGGISLDVHAFSHAAELRSNQEFYLSSHAGQLGWDIPAAIGLADSGRFDSIVCLTGDGSAMFNLQELATLRRNHNCVVVIIFDNGGYNSIRSTQDTHLCGRRFGSTDDWLAFPEWDSLATAFDYRYLNLESNDRINQIATVFTDGHWLVRVKIDSERNRTPRLISKISNGKFVSPTIFEQHPDLPPSVEAAYAALKANL